MVIAAGPVAFADAVRFSEPFCPGESVAGPLTVRPGLLEL